MEKIEIELWKSGMKVGVGGLVKEVEVELAPFLPFMAYVIPKLELDRVVVFEHLAGAPLARYLNLAGARIIYKDDQHVEEGPTEVKQVEPMFYVHGRSKVYRGDLEVSAVALIHFLGEPPGDQDLLPHLHAIYQEITTRI